MAEEKGIDTSDSETSEPSPLEEIDIEDQVDILPDEENEVETLEELPDESTEQEISNGSIESEGETGSEETVSLDPDDVSEINAEEEEEEESGNEISSGTAEDNDEFDLDEYDDDDFLGLNEDELDLESPEEADHPSGESVLDDTETQPPEDDPEAGDEAPDGEKKEKNRKEKASKKSGPSSKAKITLKRPSLTQLLITVALVGLISACGIFYANPSLIGLTRESNPVPPEMVDPTPPVQMVQKQIEPDKPPSKNEIYMAKLEEAGLLRAELLGKREEIHRLKLHYQHGIADLEAQIKSVMQKEAIISYAKALQSKSIELNLRTIQRRRAYIDGLEKPTQWIKEGSETLLYLKRKAHFDLQLVDVAAGIDMERHMRHIAAAVQKYRPSAEKLTVNRDNSDLPSIKTIWNQIKKKKKDGRRERQSVLDAEIAKEICAGNFERISELTNMSAETAKCLSRKNGSELFLNGLTVLSPAAAKYLFQWQGNWICINSVKELPPQVAKHLFKWQGKWISLNGLTEFPPELAMYLMEWEGNQLELMGLRHRKSGIDPKALKYLALWETTGGKLFISDDVRKQMERVLM